MNLAPYTASGEPWTINRNLSVFNAASYLMTLSFGIPMLTRPAPRALTPPTTTAPSRPATIQLTSGPNENWSNAWYCKECGSKEQSPEATPECSNLAPVLHPVTSVVVADDMFIDVRASEERRVGKEC